MELNLNILPLAEWLPETIDLPLLIAGPCSAETEEQVMATARKISDENRAMVFRAGIWKPRTRPNSFEGVGEIGLSWMQRVKKETRLKTTIEVANAEHVKLALKYGIDILWIGARTSVNPFSVQEIANALKGHDVPVLVKNPINADLQLWIGALERINQAGITKMAAIHRGFSPLSQSNYRNDPNWKIPVELKRLIPDLPIICDPSHISGNRALIEPVSQKAFDLQMEGLMIETHLDPDNAWSDAKQQVTPAALHSILDRIVWRQPESKDAGFVKNIEILRSQIDEVDEDLVNLLALRMNIVDEIAESKKISNVTILQVGRYEDILKQRLNQAGKNSLDLNFVKGILELIHQNSIKRQEIIMNKNSFK